MHWFQEPPRTDTVFWCWSVKKMPRWHHSLITILICNKRSNEVREKGRNLRCRLKTCISYFFSVHQNTSNTFPGKLLKTYEMIVLRVWWRCKVFPGDFTKKDKKITGCWSIFKPSKRGVIVALLTKVALRACIPAILPICN